MMCPGCGEPAVRCRCVPGPSPAVADSDAAWRHELQNRVASYRARRARRLQSGAAPPADAPSAAETIARVLPFRTARAAATPFAPPSTTPPAPTASPASHSPARLPASPAHVPQAERERTAVPGMEPIADPVPQARPAARPSAPMVEPATIREVAYAASRPRRDEALPLLTPAPDPGLAEPVRIPARERSLPLHALPTVIGLPAAGPMQIHLPAAPEKTASAPVGPAAMAPRIRRLQAALLDAACVVAASLTFALATWLALGTPAPDWRHWRLLLPAVAGVPLSLAALYTLVSFYLGEATPGMVATGLEVRTPSGKAGPAPIRRRAWLSLLSLGALGLGYGWAFCDSQTLTWHDAIAGTFLALRSAPAADSGSGAASDQRRAGE